MEVTSRLPPPARGPRGPARSKSNDPLRESMLELFSRSFERAEKQKKGSGLRVYRWFASMFYRMSGEPWAQSTIFPLASDFSRRFVHESRLQVTDVGAFVQHAIMANSWAPTWTGQFLQLDHDNFRRYVKGLGLEPLREHLKSGTGVILAHAHTVFSQVAWRLFEHEGIPEGMTLWQWTWNRPREELDDRKIRAMEGAKEIYLATRMLKDGGIVHVLADGKRGGDKVAVNFHNRRRIFQPTFAELAVGGSKPYPVFPVDVVMTIEGQVLVEIGEPIFPDAGTGGKAEMALGLVHKYVNHLSRRWANHAANLPWGQMMRHIDSPPAE